MANERSWSPAELPSRGFFYKGPNGEELLPGGRIEVSRLSFEEDSLLQSPGTDALTRMDGIIKRCCRISVGADKKPVMSTDELLLTDRLALLLYQRILSFGPSYTFNWQCPACKQKNKMTVNLATDFPDNTPDVVSEKMAQLDPPQELVEPWDVELKDEPTPTVVQCRFLRAKDERDIIKNAKRAKMGNSGPIDPSHKFRLAAQIVSVNGNVLDMPKKLNWIGRPISAADALRISNAADLRETGIDTKLVLDCGCGNSVDGTLPFDSEFFRPSVLTS